MCATNVQHVCLCGGIQPTKSAYLPPHRKKRNPHHSSRLFHCRAAMKCHVFSFSACKEGNTTRPRGYGTGRLSLWPRARVSSLRKRLAGAPGISSHWLPPPPPNSDGHCHLPPHKPAARTPSAFLHPYLKSVVKRDRREILHARVFTDDCH